MKFDLEERLEAWVADELIAPTQADAIRSAERRRGGAGPTGTGERRISLLAEALGYLGAALAVVALGLLITDLWDQIEAWARVLVAGVVTVGTFGAGWALRGSEEPAVRRLVSLLWGATVVGTGFTVAVWLFEFTALDDRELWLPLSMVVLVVATALWSIRRTPLQHVAMYVGVLLTVGWGMNRVDTEFGPLFWGLAFLGVGLAWAALSWAELVTPRTAGLVVGLITVGWGAQIMAFDDDPVPGLVTAIVVAGVLVAVSIVERESLFLVFGAIGVFVFVPQLVFEWFGDTLGAPLVLLITGLLLIVGAVGAAKLKSEVIDSGDGAVARRSPDGTPDAPASAEPEHEEVGS